jgi:hypothetical protein
MGLASAIKAKWFGLFGGAAGAAGSPAPPVHPWTLRLVGATGQADAFVGDSSVVSIPVFTAGRVEAVELCYGRQAIVRFASDRVRFVASGDTYRFDLFDWLKRTGANAELGQAVRRAVAASALSGVA